MQTPNTTGQMWEVHLRRDLPYHAATRHKLHALTGTIDGYQMAISLRYWLRVLAHPIQHGLLLVYNITEWVHASTDRDNLQPITHHTITYITYRTKPTHSTLNVSQMPHRMAMWNQSRAPTTTHHPRG